MQKNSHTLHPLLTAGVLAIVLTGANQYSLEVADKTYLSIVDPLVWVVGLVWLVHLVRTRGAGLFKPPPLLPVLFLVSAAASFFAAGNKIGAAKELFQLVEYFVVAYVIIGGYIEARNEVRTVLFVLLLSASFALVLACVQYFTPSIPDLSVGGTFGNRNVLGGFLALIVPLSFGLLLYDDSRRRRVCYLVLIGLSCLVVQSGGTVVAVAVAVIVVAAMRGRYALAGALVALGLAALLMPLLPRDNMATAFDSISIYDAEGQPSRRYPEWQAASIMTGEHPWLGVGAGNYQANIGMYYGPLPDPTGPTEPDTQNLYMVLASSMGVPALLFFVAALARFWAAGVAAHGMLDAPLLKGAALGLSGSILAFGLNSLWSPLLVRGMGIPLAVVFALTSTLREKARD